MATKIIFNSLLILLPWLSQAQSVFYNTYGGNGYDTGNDVIQRVSDSSFFIAGSSSSQGDAPSKAMLLHVNKNGEFIASYFYGGTRSDIGVRVMHKPSVGFWIAGYSNSFSDDGNFDFYLVKINEQYEVEWQKTYGTANWERLHDAILLPDEGVLLVGEVEGLGVEGKDAYVVRIDAFGEVEWEQTYSGSMNDVAYTCSLFDATSFLIGGSWGTGQWNAWIARFDFDGNVIWSRNDFLENRAGEIRELRIYDDKIYYYGNWTPIPSEGIIRRKFQGVSQLNNDVIHIEYESGFNETHISFTKLKANRFFGLSKDNHFDFFGENGPRASVFGFEGGGYYIGFTHFVHGNRVTPGRIITTLDTGLVVVGSIKDPTYSSGGSNALLLKINDETPSLETIISSPILSLESFEQTGMFVYPNPTADWVDVVLPEGISASKFLVFDASGQKVMDGSFNGIIDFSALPKGSYTISLTTNQGLRKSRILKQ